MINDIEIDEIKNTIIKNISPRRIRLFGSYAYGNPNNNSDIDLFIEVDDTEEPKEIRRRIGHLFLKRLFPLELLIYTPTLIKKAYENKNYFITEEIIEKGKVLYERH